MEEFSTVVNDGKIVVPAPPELPDGTPIEIRFHTIVVSEGISKDSRPQKKYVGKMTTLIPVSVNGAAPQILKYSVELTVLDAGQAMHTAAS